MELNKEEIDKLKRFISELEKLGRHSHFTQTSKYSFSLSAFKIQFSNPWIIHLRASDYMTNSSKVFAIYIPCMGNQKSKLLMVPLVTMAGQGDVFLTSSLTSRNVLHVPKLSVNLLSTPQITKELTCSINFIKSECSFQDLFAGKWLGKLEKKGGCFSLKLKVAQAAKHVLLFIPIYHNIILQRKNKFGYPIFVLVIHFFLLLKKIFLDMFEKLNVQNFHCDVCEYAKHHRLSFPLSNKKSFVPFSLIHTGIWGPTKVHSISRVSWIVLFVDDCIRFT